MGGGGGLNTSDTKIEALSLQSSAYGVTIPLLYGVNRIAGNLLWYGAFKATPVVTAQATGGKGGSVPTSTSYLYTASVMMGLCEGQVMGISRAWRAKQLNSGGLTPSQIVTASESYTIPGGGGAFTVSHAATLLANVSVIGITAVVVDSGTAEQFALLAEGRDYTRLGGVYTFPALSGGAQVSVTYQYSTGTVTQAALSALGLSFAPGTPNQSAWSYLASYTPATPPGGATGSQSVSYSSLCYVYAQDYVLAADASVDNHTFEMQAAHGYSISNTIPDANPCLATFDVLINSRYGAAFPPAQLGRTTDWSTYCLAANLLLSPALTEQMQASEFVALMGKVTNTAPVWSSGKLKMLPYGDVTMAGNGVTYTPNTTPIYDLGDDDFLNSADPIKVTRKPQSDAFNHVRIEFCNRANLYNIEIAEAKDSADIDANGLRSADILSVHWCCDAAIARNIAQLVLQRTLFIRNTYEFTLPWTKALLEPMDLVTLTDAGLGFVKLPVRITEISESDTGDLAVTAEEYPIGVASAATYASQAGQGFQHDYNAAPGSVAAPVIFEAPGALTVNGLEVFVAASSTNPNWGGAHVYTSLDGVNYKLVDTLQGKSRYGTLTNSPGSSGTIGVSLISGALTSGSAADAAALNTLCYVGGAAKEFFAFQTATLTGTLAYNLTANVRGAYGTAAAAHTAGDPFVRVDGQLARSGPIDLSYVGKTIHVKLTSFNLYNAAEESLAAVTDYTYTITGAQVLGNAGAAAVAGLTTIASDNVLSSGEKPTVILDVNAINAEQSGIDASATQYAITTEKAAYDTAVAALATYLATLATPTAWNTIPGDTTIVGTTFRTTFQNVYAAKQTLLNKITEQAQRQSDFTSIVAWNFSGTTEGFAATGATLTANTVSLTITSTGVDPNLVSPVFTVSGALFFKVRARVRRLAGSGWDGSLFYNNSTGHGYSGSYYKGIADTTSANWTVLEWDMSALTAGGTDWTANVTTQLRMDLGASSADVFEIDWIAIGTTAPASYGSTSADAGLTASGGATLVGTTASSGPTNGNLQSRAAYSTGAYLSAIVAAPTVTSGGVAQNPIIGLSTSLGTAAANIDFAIHPSSDGSLYRFEGGVATGIAGSWAIGDVLAVVYDRATIKYLQNGIVRYSRQVLVAAPLYLNALLTAGVGRLTNIGFGPGAAITGILPGQLVDGVQGGAINSDPSFLDLSSSPNYTAGACSLVSISGGPVGLNALQMVGSSYYQTNEVPLDAKKTYRVSVWCKQTVSGTNTLYLRLHCLNSAGTDLGYSIGIEGAGTTSGWVRYSGLMAPPAGTSYGHASIDSNNAGGGTQQFQDFRIEEVINNDLIVPGAATAVSVTQTSGLIAVAQAYFTPDGFSRNTQITSLTLASGPAPELGAATVDVLVTVSGSGSLTAGGSNNEMRGGIQNNAAFDGFKQKGIVFAVAGTTPVATVSQSARFSLQANAAVTFGFWAATLSGSGGSLSNVEMRAEVIKR